MSSEADPVKALREWCAECDGARSGIAQDIGAVERRNRAMGCGGYADAVAKGNALLSAAPAILARLEAGEGLLREARTWAKVDGHESHIARIDAFLAAKEANRG